MRSLSHPTLLSFSRTMFISSWFLLTEIWVTTLQYWWLYHSMAWTHHVAASGLYCGAASEWICVQVASVHRRTEGRMGSRTVLTSLGPQPHSKLWRSRRIPRVTAESAASRNVDEAVFLSGWRQELVIPVSDRGSRATC